MTENETHRDEHRTFDAFLPAEMAQRAEEVGVKKANMPFDKLFVLAILAGASCAGGDLFNDGNGWVRQRPMELEGCWRD
ncbi:MAG: hypothetical protein R3C03_18830 [Pirellulaceae bacterium]